MAIWVRKVDEGRNNDESEDGEKEEGNDDKREKMERK